MNQTLDVYLGADLAEGMRKKTLRSHSFPGGAADKEAFCHLAGMFRPETQYVRMVDLPDDVVVLFMPIGDRVPHLALVMLSDGMRAVEVDQEPLPESGYIAA